MGSKKTLRELKALLRAMTFQSTLEPEQRLAAERHLEQLYVAAQPRHRKRMEHALQQLLVILMEREHGVDA